MTDDVLDKVVRAEIGRIMRGDECRRDCLCGICLLKMMRYVLALRHTSSVIDRAVDKVFETPGAFQHMPPFRRGPCGKTMPCLGAGS